MTNEMRKLMESVQLNEYSLDDFSNDDYIEVLAQRIAEDTLSQVKLTHENAQKMRTIAQEMAYGMASSYAKRLRAEVDVQLQAQIDEFVDAPLGESNEEVETKIDTWFERDRAYVGLNNAETDETIIEWWDEDVAQAVEDGFLDPSDWHGSAVEYAKHLDIL